MDQSTTMDLDNFLDVMRDEGSTESEGVFTIAADKAAWKLAEFQLADRSFYPAHLLACAVANGATGLAIHRSNPVFGGHMVTFGFDGKGFTLEELEEFKTRGVLGRESPDRLRELAVVLNVAGGLGQVRFLSFSEGYGLEMRIRSQEVTVQRVEPQARFGQILSVTSLNLLDLEPSLRRCRNAPIRITVDGVRRDSPIDLGYDDPKFFAHYEIGGKVPLSVRPLEQARRPFFRHRREGNGRSAVFGMHWPLVAQTNGLKGYVNGVCHSMDHELLGFPHLFGVVTVPDLDRDVSDQDYVRNSRYEAFGEELRGLVDEFLIAFCAQPTEDLEPRLLDQLKIALDQRFSTRKTPPEVETFLAHATVQGCEPGKPPDLASLQKIGKRARQTQHFEPLEAARKVLRARARVARSQGKFREVAEWMKGEMELLKSARQEPREATQLHFCFLHLAIAETTAAHAWAQFQLERGECAAARFRALLILINELEPDRLNDLLGQFPSAWSAPLRFCLAPERQFKPDTGCAYYNLALEMLGQFESGQISLAFSTLERLRATPEGAIAYGIWLEMIWSLYKGRLGLATWARTRARLSTYWTFKAPDRLRHRRRRIQDLGWIADDGKLDHLLDKAAFTPDLLPLLLFRTRWLQQRQSQSSGLDFLSRRLLNLSFGGPEDVLSGSLPLSPFQLE